MLGSILELQNQRAVFELGVYQRMEVLLPVNRRTYMPYRGTSNMPYTY